MFESSTQSSTVFVIAHGREVQWNNSSFAAFQKQPNVIWTGDDDYLERLTSQHSQQVTTVTLRWLYPEQNSGTNFDVQWSSMTDHATLLLQNYYQWTTDDQLCKWIETPNAIRAKYDIVFNRTCDRKIRECASTPSSIKKLMFNMRSTPPDTKPDKFYTRLPKHVFISHVLRDAIVTGNGEVISDLSENLTTTTG